MKIFTSFRIAALAAGVAVFGAAAADDTPPPPPPLAAAGALPELNADDYFEGKTPGTFGKDIARILPGSKRVAIAGFRVVFITENAATASVRATYLPGGAETSAAHATMIVKLEGVDKATMRAVTDKAYAAFVQQLTAAGREVVPMEQVQPLFAQLELATTSADAPYTSKGPRGTGLAFSPAGIPLWWVNGDAYGDVGPLNQHNMRTIPQFSKDINAFVIAPMIVVDFAKMESSGNHSGLIASEAAVGASLAVAVRQLTSTITRASEVKGGLLAEGDEGYIRMRKGLAVETPFASLEQVEQEETKGFMALLTGSSKNKTVKVARTDNERYAAVSQQVLNQATGALARFFQQHAP